MNIIRDRYLKWVIIFFMLVNLYAFISDLLIIIGKNKVQDVQAPVILFAFLMFVLAGILIKNIYWILAFIFKGLHIITQTIASKYQTVDDTFGHLRDPAAVLIFAGMVSILLSTYCFYKLLYMQEISSEKYTYKWINKLENYLRNKTK